MPTASDFYAILEAVQATIIALGVTGYTTTSTVRLQKLPDYRNLTGGVVFVCPAPEQLNAQAGTNLGDDIVYGVLVVAARPSNQSLTDNMDGTLHLRQQIVNAFHNKRLSWTAPSGSGATQPFCAVDPTAVFDAGAFADQVDASALVVRVKTRTQR